MAISGKSKLVVIGNGMVGQRLLEAISAADPERFDITVLCEESRPAYDRVHLSSFFSGQTAEQLSLVPEGFFDHANRQLCLNERAVSIDRACRQVQTSSGQWLYYDKLVLATGSYPFVPPLPGKDRAGCFVYRTIDDLEAIKAAGAGSNVGVVIGGGLLGLEAAKALKDLGLTTHVVEFAPRLMAVQIDDGGGRVLRAKIEALGVQVHTGKNTREIVDGANCRHSLKFADGTELEADLVLFSAGIRPRDELAKASGLSVGDRGGIVIRDDCGTSDADIYAIGECALWSGKIYGLVAPGYQMAQVVADQLLGKTDSAFTGADMSTKLKLLGVDVASLGDAHAATMGARCYSFVDERKQIYKKLVVNHDYTRLLGGVLVGDAEDYGTWLQMMLNGLALPENPEELIVPAAPGGRKSTGLGVAALPDSAQICSCNNVSKGAICTAVQAGCASIGALKTSTKAATSCGGCTPLVTQLLKAELARQGVAVSDHLCEHFPYSRQQLFHLVRLGSIKSFDELIGKHGQGLGCDICKPTVASILASCWNEFVLKRSNAALQDTNDYFLANIQKDGTYSVVPRVPGGEITPAKLIVLGEVAKKFGLYTKITGGQRIDLFGAQVHQLPLIWKDLIAAGFESGHAYGKALRTVKSCVGSSWCRYGVQDSVGFAIQLENRYKGLRAPHKIKFAVSGCTRECAEAQSKDVGVIATEKGWNLYVCGNGGVKPRHADLLASDIDSATLISYVDRFLMFYVRTADRLQRTATWLDNLEGGPDYLKQVVCDDSLGVGKELEADMARVIDTYQCEWNTAINNPETLKRFRHFVNSNQPDDNVVSIDEREQRRPATAAERQSAHGVSAMQQSQWHKVCGLDDILPYSGVAALVDGRQIAIFRVGNDCYALDNFDPQSGVNVLSRGLVGDLKDELVVASPIYKHHYSLKSGQCLEIAASSVAAYPVKLENDQVWVQSQPTSRIAEAANRAPYKRRLVVVGNGMAAMRTVEELLELAPDAYEIEVFGAEEHGNYNRIMLSPVLAGEKRFEDIILHPKSWYAERGIKLHAGDPVASIDRRTRTVKSVSGVEASYDRLVMATGSNPIMLPVPGKNLPGVVTFRDVQDVNSMLRAAQQYHRAVVIGGGLLGLEAANGLLKQGMDVTVVHLLDTLMERQLDAAAAQLLRGSLEQRGLKFHMPAETKAILGDTRVTGVSFKDGSELPADIVVMAVGIRPNIELAKQSGLNCERGVLVNDTLQTFDPSVYAVGECVQHRKLTYGLVAPLWEQARVCATHLAELGIGRYRGSMTATQLKVTGIDLYSVGDFSGAPGSESLVMRDARRGIYKRIIIQGDRVRGAVLYGDVKDGPWYQELISSGRNIGPLRDKLLFGAAFAGVGADSPAAA